MELSTINPSQYPHLFVDPPIKPQQHRNRSFLEHLLTWLRKRRKRQRGNAIGIFAYIDHFFLYCTDTRPSRLHRSTQGTTLTIVGISHLYYQRLCTLLQAVRSLYPHVSVECKVYSQAVTFNTH